MCLHHQSLSHRSGYEQLKNQETMPSSPSGAALRVTKLYNSPHRFLYLPMQMANKKPTDQKVERN